MASRILVVAAHPDDELLGVGATIARRVSEGDEAFALILGEGQTSRWGDRGGVPASVLEELHGDTLAAAEVVGYTGVEFADLPDNRFDGVDLLDVVKEVERAVGALRPDVVYTHDPADLNVDHRVAFRAVLTATRPIGEGCVGEVYSFETLSATEWGFGLMGERFEPSVFVDVEAFMDAKCEAMRRYRSELRGFPHPRSIEGIRALAAVRGATAGLRAAEAFRLVRRVVR